jgi:predicted RNA binding protein YcfA (HicA-like mRNA interferase family)
MGDYTNKVLQLLNDSGCYLQRHGKGSHSTWFSPKTGINFVVCSKIKDRHIANGIMKQAGIEHKF